MLESALAGLAFVGSWLGFVALALSQERHWSHVSGLPLEQRLSGRGLITAGLMLQVCALVGLVHSQGPSFGALLWMVMLSATAMAVALLLTWKPQWLRPLARWVQHRHRPPLNRSSASALDVSNGGGA
jgi:hypothetical protein